MVLLRGMQETIRNFSVFPENGRPHLGFGSSKPHFRPAVQEGQFPRDQEACVTRVQWPGQENQYPSAKG